jgi:hypothetical protein
MDTPVPASAAPLDQLWALLDSGLQNGATWPDRPAGQLPADFDDFATAISARCEPNLASDQSAQLNQLRQAVITQAAQANVDLSPGIKAYFESATQLCM